MPEQLAFTSFKVWPVVVPVNADAIEAAPSAQVYSGSISWPQLTIHLVEGTLSNGMLAIGESPRGTSDAMVRDTLHWLLGRDLRGIHPRTAWMRGYNWDGLPQAYVEFSHQNPGTRSYQLLETLWFDGMGKAAGVPAHMLLGGAVRDRVLTDLWGNRPSPATLARLVARAVSLGLHGIKLKCDGTGDTVRSITAIAADVPRGFRFTIDPMNSWRSLRQSRSYFEQLAPLPFVMQLEDPFAFGVHEDWRQARGRWPITLICHARDEQVLRDGLREGVADAYNLGGSSAFDFQREAAIAEFHGKDCWQGSSLELGVGQHMRLHTAAASRNCLLPSDMQSEWVREHTLVFPRMGYSDSHALVPTAPGLGISLDHEAIRTYKTGEFSIE